MVVSTEKASRRIVPEGFDGGSAEKDVWDGWLLSPGWRENGKKRRFGIDARRPSSRLYQPSSGD